MTVRPDRALVCRLLADARGERWRVSADRFAEALAASAERAFAGRTAGGADVERYLAGLHLEDLALACACLDGDAAAWEHLLREYRPVLARAADALDPAGGAWELADALFADLYGVAAPAPDGERRALLRYFHGRSSLATWLRAVLAQRVVDRVRATRRLDPLPDDAAPAALPAPAAAPDPERDGLAAAAREAFCAALGALAARDRLRLACYYAEDMTLAAIGRLTGEHEATVSRHLARTRREIRADVERRLREAGLTEARIDAALIAAQDDAGPLDLSVLLGAGAPRKEPADHRSQEERRR